jgi:hypothetical protein
MFESTCSDFTASKALGATTQRCRSICCAEYQLRLTYIFAGLCIDLFKLVKYGAYTIQVWNHIVTNCQTQLSAKHTAPPPLIII